MGLLIGIIRKRFLVLQKSNAAWKLQLITAAVAAAQNSAANLLQVSTSDYKSGSLVAKKLQERQYYMNALETRLKQQKSMLEQQIAECDAEIKSCEEMINKGTEELFSYKAA